jgi:antirestriction protein ArdC
MEELVAEPGSAFLCGDLGLSDTPRADHACYFASWLKVLKGDNRAIFAAASAAAKAAKWLGEQEE